VITLNRRTLLRGAAGVLALPILSGLSAAAQTPGFTLPEGPMLYTRRLEQTLVDGKKLIVTRRFAVRFERAGEGYRVTGEQVGVETEAPEKLATLMRIERERVETGIFPLLLDAGGRIVASEGIPSLAGLDEAVREARALIEQRPRPAEERAELLRFVEAVHASAGKLVTQLPADLFVPTPHREIREVELPGGEKGQVTVIFTAETDPASGLMREATREVLTELGGQTRRAIESWRLDPLKS